MNKTRLIPPFVMLAATAVVAVVTYMRDFPFGNWLILVFGVMIFFLFFGEVIRQVVEYFISTNEKRERMEEEAAKAAQEEEASTQAEENPINDLPPDQ